MINKLYLLQKYLEKLKLGKEALFVEALIKEANKGGLFIEYDDSKPDMISVYLMADIDGEEKSVAEVYAYKLRQRVGGKLLGELNQKGVNPTGWWHIHAPGFTWEGKQYRGLGYGSELFLVLLKYIAETGGVIISAPMQGSIVSDDGLGLMKSIKNKPGVSSIDVALTSSLSRINIESLENLSDDDRSRLSSGHYSASQHAKDYRTDDELNDLEHKRERFLREIEEDYYYDSEEYYEKIDEFEDKSPDPDIDLSQGTVYWTSGRLPISVPVRRVKNIKKEVDLTSAPRARKTNFFAAAK